MKAHSNKFKVFCNERKTEILESKRHVYKNILTIFDLISLPPLVLCTKLSIQNKRAASPHIIQ